MARGSIGIVGAGIVGLANALAAAERGYSVSVFERSSCAAGASVRNFGMVWPIGQPAGELHAIALRSRERWLEVAEKANVWLNPCGSIHLAHRADEWEVLEQFADLAPNRGIELELLNSARVSELTTAANPHGLVGGLYSPTEICVNPRTASAKLAAWLCDSFGVKFHFSTAITNADSDALHTADGRELKFDRVVICSGADFGTLFPKEFAMSGMKKCKLQMLKTLVQAGGWRLGPHLASGLTLRHYQNFEACPALSQLKHRIAVETPELDRFGIHVMASQDDAGCVILGDSHEYDSEIEPFDKAVIDELMLRELRKIIRLPEWSIHERWHGIYAKTPGAPIYQAEPLPGVHIFTGTGGSGMTMSFGLAEEVWQRWS